MVRQAFADDEVRQRLLDGFLFRLARHPDADAFALRGGMLVRHWFPSSGRSANDIDLVCALAYDREGMLGRLREVLADSRVDDGIAFEPDRFRLDRLRPSSAHPGLRLFAAGRADGSYAELSVDLTFGLAIWPAAHRSTLVSACGQAPLWTCPPEMLIARKLQVTAELGPTHWRPKDVADIWRMLRRFSPTTEILGEALELAFEGQPESRSLETVLQESAWWDQHHAQSRWVRFTHQSRSSSLPSELGPVIGQLRTHLSAFVESP